MKPLINLLVSALAVFITAYLLPGVKVASFSTAIVVAFVFAVINLFIKPIVNIFALPFNLMTLGLFSFITNAAFVFVVASFIPGFEVQNFWWALLFGLSLSLVNSFLHLL